MSPQLGEGVIFSHNGMLRAAVVSAVNSANNVALCVFCPAVGAYTLASVPYSAQRDSDVDAPYCYPRHVNVEPLTERVKRAPAKAKAKKE